MEQGKEAVTRARALRKNATREENHLWYDFLSTYPVRFRRQVPFGPYIVDFYCEKAKLAIELDGAQHYEEAARAYDRRRGAHLERVHGLTLLRFANSEIHRRFEAVCVQIDHAVQKTLLSGRRAEQGKEVN